MCTQIPKQFSREELIKVLPDTWVTNYEKLREPVEPLQSSEPTFSKKPDKTVAISFDHSHLKKPNKTTFSFQMYQPTYNQAHQDDPETFAYHLPSIMSEQDWIKFDNEGHDVWWYKCSFTGHCPWDIQYDYQKCLDDEIEWDEHHTRRAKSKKKGGNSEREFRTRYEEGDSSIGSLSRPGKYEFLVSYKPQNWPPLPNQNLHHKPSNPNISKPEIFMMNPSSSSHTPEFPSQQPFEKDGASHAPKIPRQNVVLPTGEKPLTSEVEATINWQSENAICQNKVLTNISTSIRNVAHTQNKMMSGGGDN
ncbi:uncharacterized protein LOC132031535 [Lycium ferocissimum]|uniref:uncharacterized protein LOC132031535 n=1 Tax=Lycium ferocissimum TaxID=112874 RepID=UPI0028164D20|nr:uncharacterized protein LOC132031535 [Lycium ferocissimum]